MMLCGKRLHRSARSGRWRTCVGTARARLIAIVFSLILSLYSYERAIAVNVGGPFTLSAADGRIVTDQSFRGRWLLVYFGYTSCPDSCPIALSNISRTLIELDSDAERVQALFITLDPSRDTHKVIDDYLKSFDPRIIGLTGTQEQIDVVAHAYGSYAQPHVSDPMHADGRLDHSVYIYLMDPHGRFIRAFDPSWPPDRMADVVRHLSGSSSGAAKMNDQP